MIYGCEFSIKYEQYLSMHITDVDVDLLVTPHKTLLNGRYNYSDSSKHNFQNGASLRYKNIFNYVTGSDGEINLTDSLIIPMTILPDSTLDTTISISNTFLAYGSNSEEPVKSIEIGYEVGIESGEYTIDVINDSIKIGVPSINSIGVTNLRLEYIAAVTDSLPFPSIESPPIEGIPDGFSGFEFYDIMMEIEFFNEIGVPVGLNMELLGSKADSAETITVAIDTQIGAPYKDNYNCNFNTTGDTARTLIKLNKDYQITEYYCNSTDFEPSQIILDTLNSSGNGSNSSIVDLMNFAHYEYNKFKFPFGLRSHNSNHTFYNFKCLERIYTIYFRLTYPIK